MNAIIRQLLARESLSQAQCYTLFSGMEAANRSQQAVILSLLAAKKESVHEILAVRQFLLEHATLDPMLANRMPDNLIDLVGTGGDGVGTFNISTAASLVVASCHVPVAKHGGGRVTGLSGSADVIQALRIPLHHLIDDILDSLHRHGYAYLSAMHFNPLFQTFKPIRSQLDFPTIFNVLGPLTNPLQPKRQVVGVFRRDLVPVVASVLQATGSIHAMVVHAVEGLDELSVSGPTDIAEIGPYGIKEYRLDPRELGFPSYALSDVLGGTSMQNADTIRAIFNGEVKGAKRDIVLLNAAAGLMVADDVSTFSEGIERAADAITSGAARDLLNRIQLGAQK